MSMFKHTFAGLAFAAVTSGGVAIAQQNQTQLPPAQQNNPQTPPVQTQQDQRDVNQANQQPNQQNVSVEQALVMIMKKSNDAEIALAQLAQEKVDDQGFRQFTQQLIQDHQSLNQQLDQVAAIGNGNANRRNAEQPSATQPGAATTNPNQTANPSQPGRTVTPTEENAPGAQPNATGQRSEGRQGRGQMPGMGGGRVPPMLISIMSQACENNLKMTKEMLEQYEGQDFKMAFLGQQIVAHTACLAEMKAIESSGPEQIKAIAKQASPKIEEHLAMAKKLAKKFEDDRGSGSRSSDSPSNSDSSDDK